MTEPQKGKDAGHIYVIQFKNGMIKIGKSIDPCMRAQNIMQEMGASNDDGYRIKQMWMTEEIDDVMDKESRVHRCLKDSGTGPVMRMEYYDMALDKAIGVVKGICRNKEFIQVYPKAEGVAVSKSVRLTVLLKRDQVDDFKIYAEINGTTMTDLIAKYVDTILAENQVKIIRYKEGMQKLRESFCD